MQVTKSQQGPILIFAIEGPLIEEELPQLQNVVSQSLDNGFNKLVLNLKNVPFIDSAGLELIHWIVSSTGDADGDTVITSLNDVCQDIFKVTRMEQFTQIMDDPASGVRSLL